MGRKVEISTEAEIEVTGYVTEAFKGTYFDPPTPSEVEDLYVGVIIHGATIDITNLLNESQKNYFEQRIFDTLKDQEEEWKQRKADTEYDRRKENR